MLSADLTGAVGLKSELLGRKGAGLAELSHLGLAVPPAFILTTEAYHRWRNAGFRIDGTLRSVVADRLSQLQARAQAAGLLVTGRFLISVRSSPTVSMPGMLSTVLNVGTSRDWLDSPPDSLRRKLLTEFVRSYLLAAGLDFVQEWAESGVSLLEASLQTPLEGPLLDQVLACVDAVFASRLHPNVVDYADQRLLGDGLPVAAIVQTMVYGNRSDDSASGVLWSRDVQTGEGPCTGTYLVNVQGPQVVGSTSAREPRSLIDMRAAWPEVYEELSQISDLLDVTFPQVQEVEFTVDNRKVWLLQTRDVPLDPLAAVRYACAKVDSGAWTSAQAVARTRRDALPSLVHRATPVPVDPSAGLLARGIPAAAGAATGPLVIRRAGAGESLVPENAILLADSLAPQDDFELMKTCAGFITIRGGPGTHTASLLRKLGKPYIVSSGQEIAITLSDSFARFGPDKVAEGETVTILGSRGELFRGQMDEPQDAASLKAIDRFAGWMRRHGSASSWQVFNYPGEEADQIRQAVGSVLRRHTWESEKAVVADLLGLAPEQWRVRQEVFAAADRDSIRRTMLAGIEAGFWIGPKVCRRSDPLLGSGPYQTGIRTARDVDSFLDDPAYTGRSRDGGYLRWISDPAVTELVVVFDPPGKGEPALEAEHFICTVSCVSSPAQLQISLMLGTSRLRSFESASAQQVMLVTVEPDYQHPQYLGHVRPAVGRDYWTGQSPGTHAELALSRGDWSFKRLRGVVDDRSLTVGEQVTSLITRELWKPPFDLAHYMIALDDEFGIDTLEFQGRADSSGRLSFFKLFDAKGHEEQLFASRD